MSRPNAVAKGRALQRLAKEMLEAQGRHVETAPNVVRWVKNKPIHGFNDSTNRVRPISTRHDFFGVWDGVAVRYFSPREVMFYQVTVLPDVAHRRRKILASDFPATSDDVILGYKPGRDRHFRVFRGPKFDNWTGETWRPVKKTGPLPTAAGPGT